MDNTSQRLHHMHVRTLVWDEISTLPDQVMETLNRCKFNICLNQLIEKNQVSIQCTHRSIHYVNVYSQTDAKG